METLAGQESSQLTAQEAEENRGRESFYLPFSSSHTSVCCYRAPQSFALIHFSQGMALVLGFSWELPENAKMLLEVGL